jgi:hypothetical protein
VFLQPVIKKPAIKIFLLVIAQPVFCEYNIVEVLASAEKIKKCIKYKLLNEPVTVCNNVVHVNAS